jgi:hypothetical protein
MCSQGARPTIGEIRRRVLPGLALFERFSKLRQVERKSPTFGMMRFRTHNVSALNSDESVLRARNERNSILMGECPTSKKILLR